MAEFILKNRYGKDRSFDKETIFVQGADGELMQFTHGTGNPVIESLEITENGTYNAPDGVDGYDPVTVNVPAPEIKLQDKTITENGEYTADSGFDGLGKVTVEVKGSGGASLPAGGYWGPFEDIKKPNTYTWNFFELNGELYAFVGASTTSEGSKYRFKMVDGSWEQLADETWFDCNMAILRPVEYNGKLHFVPGDEYKKHWTFDGEVVKQIADFPGYIYPGDLFAQDGKLKVYYRNKVYVWDEVNDTWSEEATLSFLNYNIGIYVVDGIVYMSAVNNIYIYTNNTVSLYYTGLDTVYNATYTAVVNGKLYYYKSDSQTGVSLYCFDFATKTNVYVTKVPTHFNYGAAYLKGYHDKVLSLPHTATYGYIFQLYEISE